jgi:hypothetical protein
MDDQTETESESFDPGDEKKSPAPDSQDWLSTNLRQLDHMISYYELCRELDKVEELSGLKREIEALLKARKTSSPGEPKSLEQK